MRRIQQLTSHGFLQLEQAMMPHFPDPIAPVAYGRPGLDHFSAGSIAYKLSQAWKALPWRNSTIIRPTSKTAKFLGLPLPRKVDRLAHDSLCGEIALFYLRTYPKQGEFLRGEDLMAHTRMAAGGYLERLPDAFITNSEFRVTKVIEIGTNRLDSRRVRSFIDDCTKRGIHWEIWGA